MTDVRDDAYNYSNRKNFHSSSQMYRSSRRQWIEMAEGTGPVNCGNDNEIALQCVNDRADDVIRSEICVLEDIIFLGNQNVAVHLITHVQHQLDLFSQVCKSGLTPVQSPLELSIP